MARFMRTDLGRGHSNLRPPAVVATAVVGSLPPPLQGYLTPADQTARAVRQQRLPHSHLRGPTVIGVGISYAPLAVHLVIPGHRERIIRRRPKSVLRPPQVVTATATFVQLLNINLAPHNAVWRRQNQRSVQSVLRKPVVIDLSSQVYRIVGRLTPTAQPNFTVRQRQARSVLRPPQVVAATSLQLPLSINLAPHNAVWKRQSQRSVQTNPIVIDLSPQVYRIVGRLTPTAHPNFVIRQRAARSVLRPPRVVTAVAAEVYYGPNTTLARGHAAPPIHSRFIYPIVVFDVADVLGGLSVTYVRRPTPSTRSRLSAPAVLAVEQRIYYAARAPLVRIRPRPVQSVLRPPRVVFLAVEIYGPEVHVVRRPTPPVVSFLRPPVVVRLAVEIYGPRVYLARNAPKPTLSLLRAPVVVFLAVEIYGPETTLVRIRPVPTQYLLRPPTVIDLRPQVYYLRVTLARNQPKPTTYFLRPPADTVGLEDQGQIRVHLAPSHRLSRGAHSQLRPPTVVAPVLARPIAVHFAYSLRGRALSRLLPPAVVQDAGLVFYGPAAYLTYSRRGKSVSRLAAPTVIDVSPQVYYLQTTLVRIRPVPTTHFLRPPADTVGLEDQGKVVVHLAPSHRLSRQAKSVLRPPIVVFLAVEIYGPETHIVRRPTPPTLSRLRKPVVIDLRPQTYYLTVTLAPSHQIGRQRQYFAILRPPRVVQPLGVRFDGPVTTLTYSRRGKPKSILRKPIVIDLRPQTRFLNVNLTYSRRGRPISFFTIPTVVNRQAVVTTLSVHLTYSRRGKPKSFLRNFVVRDRFFGPVTTLTYSLRGRPLSRLQAPVVVREFIAPPLVVHLAYSRRGRPVYELRPPTVVAPVLARPIVVSLAPQSRGRPKSKLRPPAVVAPFLARAIQVTLAPQSRGKTRSRLLPPAVVGQFVAPAIQVTFARNAPKPTVSFLRRPPVVNTPQPVLYPVQVTLAYSVRGTPIWFLRPPTVTQFVPDEGDVCGFDSAGAFICGEDGTVVDVCTEISTEAHISGASAGGSTITGGDSSTGEVFGGDQENT